jgi:hypothetical protein
MIITYRTHFIILKPVYTYFMYFRITTRNNYNFSFKLSSSTLHILQYCMSSFSKFNIPCKLNENLFLFFIWFCLIHLFFNLSFLANISSTSVSLNFKFFSWNNLEIICLLSSQDKLKLEKDSSKSKNFSTSPLLLSKFL